MSDKEKKDVKKDDKDKKAFARKKKAPALDVDKKLKQIEKSKLSKSEKERYSAMIQKKAEDKGGVPFDVYASARQLSRGELAGKRAMAKSKGKSKLSIKDWDNFFKKF